MASHLLESPSKTLALSIQPIGRLHTKEMRKDIQPRISALLLALLTLAAVIFAGINFWKEGQYPVPTDGVWWIESGNGLKAVRLTDGGPAERAGIKPGDALVAVDEQPIENVKDAQGQIVVNAQSRLVRQQWRLGVWSKATYKLVRNGFPLETQVILIPTDKSLNQGLRLIALIYLGIGLYVLLRRWTAPKSTHF